MRSPSDSSRGGNQGKRRDQSLPGRQVDSEDDASWLGCQRLCRSGRIGPPTAGRSAASCGDCDSTARMANPVRSLHARGDGAMKLALVTTWDPHDPSVWAGTGYHIAKALEAQSCAIEYVGPLRERG